MQKNDNYTDPLLFNSKNEDYIRHVLLMKSNHDLMILDTV